MSARESQQHAYAQPPPTRFRISLPNEDATGFDHAKPIIIDRLAKASETNVPHPHIDSRGLDAARALYEGITIIRRPSQNEIEFQLQEWRTPCDGFFCNGGCPASEPCVTRAISSAVKWRSALKALASQRNDDAFLLWNQGELRIERLIRCQEWFLRQLFWPKAGDGEVGGGRDNALLD